MIEDAPGVARRAFGKYDLDAQVKLTAQSLSHYSAI